MPLQLFQQRRGLGPKRSRLSFPVRQRRLFPGGMRIGADGPEIGECFGACFAAAPGRHDPRHLACLPVTLRQCSLLEPQPLLPR